MAKSKAVCTYCNEPFLAENKEINRGGAKYCSISCASKPPRSISYDNLCKHCGKEFFSSYPNARYCSDSCKQKNYRLKSRTSSITMKTLYVVFGGFSCEICGWSESVCDLHHIVEVSKGGANEPSNIIVVCPNHHRMIHKNLVSKDKLLQLVKDRTISSSFEKELDAVSGN